MLRKIVNPLGNVYTIKVLRYGPSLAYLLQARTIKQCSSLNPVIQLSFRIAPIPKGVTFVYQRWPYFQMVGKIINPLSSGYLLKVLRYAPSLTYVLRARTMKQLPPWFLVSPLKSWLLDDDWTKQMAGSEVLSSTIFDPSSVRMSNQSAVAMKWKCSDMRHHRFIFCGLEPWIWSLICPLNVLFLDED